MPPKSYGQGLAQAMGKALIDLVPMAGAAKKILDFHVDYFGETWSAKRHEHALDILVADITALIQLLDETAAPGTANSAAADFISIVKDCKITPKLLVDLQLDPSHLRDQMLRVAAPALAKASSERERFVRQAIELFSERLIEISPLIPGIEIAYRQAVLACMRRN